MRKQNYNFRNKILSLFIHYFFIHIFLLFPFYLHPTPLQQFISIYIFSSFN